MLTPKPVPLEVGPRPGKAGLIYYDWDGKARIGDVADYFDIEVKRLRGWIFRNALADPIGNVVEDWVYPFSVERFLKTRESRS